MTYLRVSILTFLISLATRHAVSATIPAVEYQEVFTLQITSVSVGAWDPGTPQRRTLNVQANLTIVLRDASHKLATGPLQVSLRQTRWGAGRIGDNADRWSDVEVQSGQQYIIFSNQTSATAKVLVEDPDSLDAVGATSAIADLQLILRTREMSEAQQVRAIEMALQERHHDGSPFLASFAARLMSTGQDASRMGHMLTTYADTAFTEEAKKALLFTLAQKLKGDDEPQPEVASVFSTLLAKFFLDSEGNSASRLSAVQSSILAEYIPWLRNSFSGRKITSSLPPPLATAFEHKLTQVAQEPTIPAGWRSEAGAFAAQIHATAR